MLQHISNCYDGIQRLLLNALNNIFYLYNNVLLHLFLALRKNTMQLSAYSIKLFYVRHTVFFNISKTDSCWYIKIQCVLYRKRKVAIYHVMLLKIYFLSFYEFLLCLDFRSFTFITVFKDVRLHSNSATLKTTFFSENCRKTTVPEHISACTVYQSYYINNFYLAQANTYVEIKMEAFYMKNIGQSLIKKYIILGIVRYFYVQAISCKRMVENYLFTYLSIKLSVYQTIYQLSIKLSVNISHQQYANLVSW